MVAVPERSASRLPQTAQRAEGVIHRGSLVPAVHHAIGTLGISGLRPVVLPLRGRQQFRERIGITVLQ